MSWSGKSRRPTAAQARAFWAEELTEAARGDGKVRIACSPEEHAAIRREAERIGEAEGCEVAFDGTQPRIVAIAFSRRPPAA